MSETRILIIGAGKRVRNVVLPVLDRLADVLPIQRIFARSTRSTALNGKEREIVRIDDLTQEDLRAATLVYLAVPKDQVPVALNRLAKFDLGCTDLLIDTPVLLFKHYYHRDKLRSFRAVWVTEDCTTLPCFDPIQEPLRGARFFQSAYKYHGLATAKTLLGCNRIRFARRRKTGPGTCCRVLKFVGGAEAQIFEPRDYSKGTLELEGKELRYTDDPVRFPEHQLLEPIRAGDQWTGFQAGSVETMLSEDEIALLGPGAKDASIVSRMDDMKRVGLYRLFRKVLAGQGAYPLDEALDDMVIDYLLEKVGCYPGTPLFSVKSALGSVLLRRFTALLGR